MMDSAINDELLAFFDRYLSFYKDFLELETAKYNDISRNNYEAIDGRVKEEEVFMLRSKGLEIERDKLLSKAGAAGIAFRELIPLVESPRREKIAGIYGELSKVLLDLKEVNKRANDLTGIRLRRIHSDLEKLDKNPELKKVYNARARGGGELTGMLSKKI